MFTAPPRSCVLTVGLLLTAMVGVAPAAGAEEPEVADPAAGQPRALAEAEPTGDVGDTAGIEEITITARRREESLQEAPLSITAFSEKGLEALNVRDLTELTMFTPNLRFIAGAAQSTNAQIYIRGIGQSEGTINAEPRVGLYIDDVYQARPLGSILSIFDLQRVEVLRGPQGTLYGKNAIGGAINVISNDPGPEYDAKIEIELGSHDLFATRLMGNMPVDVLGLGDKLFLRANIVYEDRDGYLRDRYLNQKFASHNLRGGTASIRFVPLEGLDLKVNYSHTLEPQKSRRGECRLIASKQGSAFMRAISSGPGMTAAGGSFVDACAASHELDISTNMKNLDELEAKKIHGFISWDTPEIPWLGSLKLQSITAYQSLDQNFNFDWDSTAFTLIHSEINDLGHAQLSQELRLHGGAWDDRVQWSAGGFYMKEHSWGPPTYTELLAPDFKVAGQYWPLGVGVTETSNFDHRTAAGFVFGSVEPVERLHVNAGYRYGWEKKFLYKAREIDLCFHVGTVCSPAAIDGNGDYNLFDELKVPSSTVASVTNGWTASTGNLTLRYELADDLNAFAGYQRGFSSGGFNYIGDERDQTPNSFDPESLDGVEVGVKSTWLDHHLTVNVNYFWNYYHDMQVRIQEATNSGTRGQFVGVSDVIRNAGNATLQGGELEVVAMPVDGLLLTGNLGLTFPKYDGFRMLDADATREATHIAECGQVDCPGGLPDDVVIQERYADYTNNDFANTPQVSFNLGVRYVWQVHEDFELEPAMDYSYQSKVFFDVANTSELFQDGTSLLNASLALKIVSSRTRLVFWIKNATDEIYRTSGFSLGSYASLYYGLPRTMGITFTQRFGH